VRIFVHDLPSPDNVRRAVARGTAEQQALLQDLVRAESLPDAEGPAQRLLADRYRELGLDVTQQPVRFADLRHHPAFGDDGCSADGRHNVIGRWSGADGGGAGRSLVLNGHVDVVPPGAYERWSAHPFSGRIEGGRLHGRGACDMKAGLVAAVGAVAALRSLGFAPAGTVTLQSVVGEETGGAGTLAALLAGYTADAAVILEPTSLRACPIQSGATTFRLRVQGRAAHGATPRQGVSAIDAFAALLPQLAEMDARRQARVRPEVAARYPDPGAIAPLSIGTVRAGDWHSTVPDRLVAEGRLGILPGEAVATARDELEAAVAAAAARDPRQAAHPPSVEWFEAPFESGATALDAPILTTLAEVHGDLFGERPEVRGVPYGSDLRLFTNHAGMPAVLYGPGDVQLAHAVDEWVDLDELRAATEAVALLVARWCGAACPATSRGRAC
jgi:acetylornithine deacetylase